MITKFGEKIAVLFQRFMPDAFVFAIILTIFTAIAALVVGDIAPFEIVKSWYTGFWSLLEFGMQIVLIIITGFAIALSPSINNGIDLLANYIKTPKKVYFFVVLIGTLLTLISFGWVVITCVLARELANRVSGVHYPYLVASVYFSSGSWVLGFSSSIPLLLNTPNNYLIENGVLTDVIPMGYTLGSSINIAMIGLFLCAPILFLLLAPKKSKHKELKDLLIDKTSGVSQSIQQEVEKLRHPENPPSDKMNNSQLLQLIIALGGFSYIVYHFSTRGFDLNFNIMIFIFLMTGLLLHKTPMRYVIAMKKSSSNVSGILFQYPFYAGIMGIMIYTGLGGKLAEMMASVATEDSYPFFAYVTGLVMNFAIPSAGGEFAVVGPSVIAAVQELGASLPTEELTAMISRASLSVAYGESLSNALQPFYLLLVLPIMGTGIRIQARDIMGYLVIPFLVFFIVQVAMLLWWPI